MGVDIHREGNGGVAESFGDDLGGDTSFEEKRRVGVTQVVKPNSGNIGFGDSPVTTFPFRIPFSFVLA